MNDPITSFTKDYRWLSNFFGCQIDWDAAFYPSVEHAYQAMKTDSTFLRNAIRRAPSPFHAKKMGNALSLRPDWDQIRVRVMRDILLVKFAEGKRWRRLLEETGNRTLIEGNNWNDRFWGQCPVGDGANYLGKLLMSIRRGDHGNDAVKEYETYVQLQDRKLIILPEIKTHGKDRRDSGRHR